MVTEIELKARVQNSEDLKLLLCEKAEFLYAFEKQDSYWEPTEASDLPPSGLRIRREKRTFQDGKVESLTLVTFKTKEVRDGIEINDEREFSVKPEPLFEEFLRRLRLRPGVSKKKRGWAFIRKGINAELMEVSGLGWFLELEIIAEGVQAGGSREENFTEGKKRLLDFLSGLGIAEEAIESRYYTQMLKELGRQRRTH
jgi:adenylate cyclase class 2